MIIGKIQDLERYKGLSKPIDDAIDYVVNTNLFKLEVGKYVVNENVIVNRQRYIGKDFKDAAPETHKKYIDLQIVLRGREAFGYAHINNPSLKVVSPYNEEKDIEKYTVKDEALYEMTERSFALVFPEDVHRPAIKLDEHFIEKVVIKIRVV